MSEPNSDKPNDPAGADASTAWHQNHIIGLAIAAMQQGDIKSAKRLLDESGNNALTLVDVFELYQLELETRNEELHTTRNRTEQTLEWFGRLFRNLPSTVFILDHQGVIVDANDNALSTFEFGQAPLIEPLPIRRLMADASAELKVARAFEQAKIQSPQFVDPVCVRTLQNKTLWAEIRFVKMPPRDHLGQHDLYLCMIHDRTDQVAAERAREAADSANKLRIMAEISQQTSADLLRRVSHEFRTPLNAVIGFSDLLLSSPTHLQTVDAQKFVKHIRDAGVNLLYLVDEVLQLNKTIPTQVRDKMAPVDLGVMATDAAAMMMPLAQQKGIQLSVRQEASESTPPLASGYARYIREVLINLISNALKYNKPDGWIRISTGVKGQSAWISVDDSGKGMSSEQISHLFEPFNRLGLENEHTDGHGLGLCITRSLIETMQGTIRVTSTPGVGSSFLVELPLHSQ